MINKIGTYNNTYFAKNRQAQRMEKIEKQGMEDGRKGVCSTFLQNNLWNEEETKIYITGYNVGANEREEKNIKYLSDGIIKFTEETGVINYNLAHAYAIKNL